MTAPVIRYSVRERRSLSRALTLNCVGQMDSWGMPEADMKTAPVALNIPADWKVCPTLCILIQIGMRPLCILSALALSAGTLLAEEVVDTDAMTDEELRRYRNARVAELKHRAQETKPEKTADGTVYRIFFCSVYYTPKESGFSAARGFDATPITAPGLSGRVYPRSFLQAVKREGFGRMIEAVNGREYIQYLGRGRYTFAKAPLGNRGNVLVPRKSCAISSRNPHLRASTKLQITSALVAQVTGSTEWEATDTGGGIHPLQLDLYWGEDEPRGPVGRQVACPAGARMEYAFEPVVIVK